MSDFTIYSEGSLVGIQKHTPAAEDWVDENLESESWQWLGNILWIDHRLAQNIVDGIINDDLTVSETQSA